MSGPPMRVCILIYRGNPHSGGQGVYTRYLARELTALGHTVEVVSGQPYPELDDGIVLHKLESMDLYRPDNPFYPKRWPRSGPDFLELGMLCTGSFTEPLTFSLRANKWLKRHGHRFDVVLDNQCLGYGMLQIAKRMPLLATVHHPITVDKRLDMERSGPVHKLSLRRWYSFIRMQKRVARRLPRLLTVSETSRIDIIDELGVDPARIDVVPVGVDKELFRPRPDVATVPGRLLTVASSDVPLKGLRVLIEALAKVRVEVPNAHLVIIGRMRPEDPSRRTVAQFGLEDAVTFTGNIDQQHFFQLYGEAEVAVVPSLYEGFSLPAVQAMASGIPLVCTRAGAIPEVAGTDGETALIVEPGDPSALAGAMKRMLTDGDLRARLSAAAYERALDKFTWAANAKGTAEQLRKVVEAFSC